MSLQVWLPMTEDLRQQGLSDVAVTNNGATFNSSGKLGGCYQFGTGDSYITIDPTPLKTFTEFSFACWVKIISWNTSYSTIFAVKNGTSVGWKNLIFSLLRNSSNSTLCFNVSDGSNYTSTSCQTGTLSLNTWYHITCTYKSGEIKLYQDGDVISAYETTVVPNFNSIVNLWIGKGNANSYQSNNLMNDVRIYDHCLSPMEVKRISQGLILHYPLNNMGFGQENLAKNTGNREYDRASQVEWKGYNIGVLPIENNETITISFDLKMKIETAITNGSPYLLVYNTNYRGPHGAWLSVTNSSANPIMIPKGNYPVGTLIERRCSFTTQTASSFNPGSNVDDWIEFYSNYDTENEIHIYNIKVEKGAIATPWSPAPSDTLADTMGLNSNIEYDSSGYCHNANRVSGHDNLLLSDPKGYVPSAYNAYSIWMSENLKANQTYTIQFWDVNVSHSAKSAADLGIDVYWGGGSIRLKYWHGTSYFTNGHADHLVGTFTVTDAQASGSGSANSWLNLYNSVSNADGTRSMSIGKWKLEKGSVATSWTPGSYKSYTTDSPKYNVSAEFDGVDSATVPSIFDSTTRHSELTIAAWVKRTSDDANYHYYLSSSGVSVGIRPYNSVNNYYLISWNHATDSSSSTNSWINTVMPLNTWVHNVWTFNHGVVKHYINGELEGTSDRSATGTYILGDICSIIGTGYSTSSNWEGGLSDLRIYATVLSATDIKSLYQNSATIDADGTIHGAIR